MNTTIDPLLRQGLDIPWKAGMHMTYTNTITGSSAWNIVPYDTVYYDPTNSCTIGANARFTAPNNGLYVVTAAYCFGAANAFTGEGWGALWKNGVQYANATHWVTTNNGVNPTTAILTFVQLNLGDYIDFRVACNAVSGAILGPNIAGVGRVYLQTHWIAPH